MSNLISSSVKRYYITPSTERGATHFSSWMSQPLSKPYTPIYAGGKNPTPWLEIPNMLSILGNPKPYKPLISLYTPYITPMSPFQGTPNQLNILIYPYIIPISPFTGTSNLGKLAMSMCVALRRLRPLPELLCSHSWVPGCEIRV